MNQRLMDLATGLNLELTPWMLDQIDALAQWLEGEGVASGGLGPRETDRIADRHLLDSLSFAAGWESPPDTVADFGSGVGLPGLVLAVVWPFTRVTLIDRSSKRCDLARRATRVAEIEGVEVVQADIFSVSELRSAIVSRAAAPASTLRPLLEERLLPEGRAVVSGDGRPVEGFSSLRILDQPSRLLMMQKS
ncbi:MAG: 16S rRNA (guanine(527)-N(7))-methyltransferase RsmG [Acidimicrobiia bacterium]